MYFVLSSPPLCLHFLELEIFKTSFSGSTIQIFVKSGNYAASLISLLNIYKNPISKLFMVFDKSPQTYIVCESFSSVFNPCRGTRIWRFLINRILEFTSRNFFEKGRNVWTGCTLVQWQQELIKGYFFRTPKLWRLECTSNFLSL